MLRPAEAPDLKQLFRTFTLRSREGFAENFGPALIARVSTEAPGVRLCFVQKLDKDSSPLRDGAIDLETAVVESSMGPELRTQALFRDRFIGVVRQEHPLSQRAITLNDYIAGRHIGISRQGQANSLIDDALDTLGLARDFGVTVGGFATALARSSDLIACVPERHTASLRTGMYSFALPLPIPDMTISLCWHPRLQADPAHRWLRELVLDVCSDKD